MRTISDNVPTVGLSSSLALDHLDATLQDLDETQTLLAISPCGLKSIASNQVNLNTVACRREIKLAHGSVTVSSACVH